MVWHTLKRLFRHGKRTAAPKSKDLKQVLRKTSGRFEKLFGSKTTSQDWRSELEASLYEADLGTTISQRLLNEIDQLPRDTALAATIDKLRSTVTAILKRQLPLDFFASQEHQNNLITILMIGVNGAGKTTTTGKLAGYFKNHGKRVLLAGADTFRAAAAEQLTVWAKRLDINCIRGDAGADPAAVVFDACSAAKARNIDVLLVDTAGRLHTKENLMNMLAKTKRSVQKATGKEVDYSLLVIDGTLGQNSLLQAREFNELIDIDGLIVTKLDGSAKGGAVVAIVDELNVPVVFVGVGESLDDLKPFDPDEYAAALFPSTQMVN